MLNCSFSLESLHELANAARQRLIHMAEVHRPALASSLASVDLIVTVCAGSYSSEEHGKPSSNRDRILLFKGHALHALAATLSELGCSTEWSTFRRKQVTSDLCWHPGLALPGIALNSVSLGELLAIGTQLARNAGLRDEKGKVFIIGSSAQLNTVVLWDSLQFIAAQGPQRVVLVIENQGPSHLRNEPFTRRFDAFGWDVQHVDGHSLQELREALHGSDSDRPRVVIADTDAVNELSPSQPEEEAAVTLAIQLPSTDDSVIVESLRPSRDRVQRCCLREPDPREAT